MRRLFLMTVLLAAVAVASCQKTEQTGTMVFSLSDGDVIEVETKGNVSDYASVPSESAFMLEVKSGKTSIWSGSLTDWDPEFKLKAGNYSAEVWCGSAEEEGWSKPYFYGSEEFSIFGGQVSAVDIPVSLGNCIVKIACTDMFKNYYPSYSFTITTGAGNEFEYKEGGLFMDAYKFTVSGKLTAQNGKTSDIEPKTWNVEAAKCYTVKFDVSNVGGVKITVSFDNTVETVELIEDLNE